MKKIKSYVQDFNKIIELKLINFDIWLRLNIDLLNYFKYNYVN